MIKPSFGTGSTPYVAELTGKSTGAMMEADAISKDQRVNGGDVINKLQGAYGDKVAIDAKVAQNEQAAEANNAKIDVNDIFMSSDYRDLDDTGKADYLDVAIAGLPDKGKAYQDSFKNYAASEYKRTYDGRNTQQLNAMYSTAGSDYASYGGEIAPDKYIDMRIAGDNRLNPVVLGRALMIEGMGSSLTMIGQANTPEELDIALEGVADLRDELSGPMFLGTKSKQGQELVTDINSRINLAIKQKQGEFKFQAGERISQATNTYGTDTLGPNPLFLEKDLITFYGDNPVTLNGKVKEMTKGYEDQHTRLDFMATNSPTTIDYGVDIPDVAKDQWEEQVNDEGMRALATGDTTSFIEVASRNNGSIDILSTNMKEKLNNENDKDSFDGFVSTVNNIIHQAGGVSALTNTLGVEGITKMYVIQTIAGLDGQDLVGARDIYNKAGTLGSGRMVWKGSNQDKMENIAEDLGTNAAIFQETIKTINRINPELTGDSIKKLKKYFRNGIKKVEGKNVNMLFSPDIVGATSLNPDRVTQTLYKAVGESTTELIHLPNGVVAAIDEFGIPKVSLNIKSMIAQDNEQVIEENSKTQFKPEVTNTIDMVQSKTINFFDGALNYTFGRRGLEKDIRDFFKSDNGVSYESKKVGGFFGVNLSESIDEVLVGLEETSKMLDTPKKDYEEYIGTLPPTSKEIFNNNVDRNLLLKQKVDKTIDAVKTIGNPVHIGNTFYEMLKEQENGQKKGYDSTTDRWVPHSSAEGGTSTIAYGHKLTPGEARGNYVTIGGAKVSLAGGITDEQANTLLQQDLSKSIGNAEKTLGKKLWSKTSYKNRLISAELDFNTKGGLKAHKGFLKNIRSLTPDSAIEKINRSYTTPEGKVVPLRKRVNAIKDWWKKVS